MNFLNFLKHTLPRSRKKFLNADEFPKMPSLNNCHNRYGLILTYICEANIVVENKYALTNQESIFGYPLCR